MLEQLRFPLVTDRYLHLRFRELLASPSLLPEPRKHGGLDELLNQDGLPHKMLRAAVV